MPYCSRIGKFEVVATTNDWTVTIHTPLSHERVNFRPILKSAILGSRLISTGPSNDPNNQMRLRFSIPQNAIEQEDLFSFLMILKRTVTISDTADESHALGLHHLFHLTEDPGEPSVRKRTAIGDLMSEAKSYNPFSGDRRAALELAEEMISWVKQHPRYMKADGIMSAPPSDPSKRYDLPEIIATLLSQSFGYRIVPCTSGALAQAQKTLDDPEALRRNVLRQVSSADQPAQREYTDHRRHLPFRRNSP